MDDKYYKKKYLKYKSKYFTTLKNYQNEQKGGLYDLGIYIIFYSSKDSKCDMSKYKHDDTVFSFKNINEELGKNTYTLHNRGNELKLANIEGNSYNQILRSSINILKNKDSTSYSTINKH